MSSQFERTESLIGKEGSAKLCAASVIIFGIGGVGSYAAEALARAGIGRLTLVDNDVVDITNINRQIPALHSTIGKPKTEVMAARIKDINPECEITIKNCFFMPETADDFDFGKYEYVVDAVDTVTAKITLAEKAYNESVPIIASMGTGNKLDPTAFKIAHIEDTKMCPLARVMRKELKNRGITGLKVLYSEEEPLESLRPPGSISFVPSVAGLIIAGEVIKEILQY